MGVIMTETEFAMVSEWMSNGNINQFVRENPEANRFHLVSCSRNLLQQSVVDNRADPQLRDVAKGLVYMHDQGMIHGDLKGVCLVKLQSSLSPQWLSPIRQISLSIKHAVPGLQISDLSGFSPTPWRQTPRHGVVPFDG